MIDLEHIDIHCACNSPEHTLQLLYDPEDNDLYIHVYLTNLPFYKRFWAGVKYVIGLQSKWHFEECMFNPKDADRMIELFGRIKQEDTKRKV